MKLTKYLVITGLLVGMAAPLSTEAAKGEQGTDLSIWNGAVARFGYDHDKFTIAQIGGYNESGLYDQPTYAPQVASAIAQGKRAHTYVWYDTWGSMSIAKQTMDYFLPKIQTPKGSIIALDFESGAGADKQANTETILYGMRRIQQAGYTPMYYSYKPFTLAHVDYKRIIQEFPNSLWIAGYPSYDVTPNPLYAYFPSMEGVAIWQFTSTYVAGGLDGNVDLTGITDNGYTKQNEPKTDTPAIDDGKQAEVTPPSAVKVGDTAKVNFNAAQWATGEAIPQWVKGNSYQVLEVSGDKVLLADVLSWIAKKDIEVVAVDTTTPAPQPATQTHVVKSGETLSGIAAQYGTTYQAIANLNRLSNPNLIYPSQQLLISGQAQRTNVYTVVYGDTLSGIARRLSTTYQALATANGLANPNLIYPGQQLVY